MSVREISGPIEEPVTLAEVKEQVRVTHSAEDDLLLMAVSAAREQCEQQIRRDLVTKTWETVADRFPAVEFDLEKPHVLSILSISYIDEAGVAQTLDPSSYVLDDVSSPCFVLPAYGRDWPSTLDTANAVRVRFTAGYGAAGDVPKGIKAWIRIYAATLYACREQFVAGNFVPLPGGFVDRLLDPYRVYA